MAELPTGTITFLFTDIEGSTQLWEQHPELARAALARHDALIEDIVSQYRGQLVRPRGEGDSRFAVFFLATDAVGAAASVQQALFAEPWNTPTPVRVRMALHTGEADLRDGDYYGSAVNRCARLRSAGYGGQTLLSEVTFGLVRGVLPNGVTMLDMGEHRLKDLIRPEHIFQLVLPDLPSHFPPLKTLDSRPNNLPLQPTPLVGREKELAEVEKLSKREEVRLLTLTGPGGTGKTRLGLQLASELLDDFPDGVWFVDLSPLKESTLVLPTIAQVLGVKEGAGGTPIIDTLKEHLKDKGLLLVLDNFEQVADAAPQVSQLLASSPRLKVLVTSRVPLSIRGEKEYPVPPLSVPDVHHLPSLERLTRYESVRLFIERATDVKPDFQITNENAPAVAEICARLDGLPLAIELAAARTKLFSPQALLVRLSSRLSGRLKLLTGGAKDLPARQQTLRSTIEWSYDLLSDGEKQFFWRLAPFSGGRALEALEAVCNYDGQLQVDVLEGVQTFLDNSLLQQREGREGEPRFWMLETIHEYATEKLEESGESEALQREHARYFMELAEQAEPHLTGGQQAQWLARLEDEHENMREALRWARGAGRGESANAEAVEIGLRINGAIWWFWQVRGYLSEGREQIAEALRTPSGGQQREEARGAKANALNGAGYLAWLQGDYTSARSLYEESLALRRELGDKKGVAQTLNNLGLVAQEQGDYTSSRSLHEESLALRRELGDLRGISISLNSLGLVAQEQQDYASARSLHEESLALRRDLGDERGISISLNNLGLVAQEQGDYILSRSLHEESLALSRELGDKRGIAQTLNNLGLVAQEQQDYASARSLYEESLAMGRELGDKLGIAGALAGLGGVALGSASSQGSSRLDQTGKVARGARLLGAVEVLLESIGAVLDIEDRLPYERAIASARAQLDEAAFTAAWAEGRAMSMEQAIEYALHEDISNG